MKKELLYILFITLFVIVVWIVSDFFHARPQNPVKNNLEQLLLPLNPIFDQQVINNINKTPPITDSVLSTTAVSVTPSPAPEPTSPSPTALPSLDTEIASRSAVE